MALDIIMNPIIVVTECKSNIKILVPLSNLAYCQDSDKGEKDTYVRLKTEDLGKQKYFFVKETLNEIAAQLREIPKPLQPIMMTADEAWKLEKLKFAANK
jgi:hypothetical protein